MFVMHSNELLNILFFYTRSCGIVIMRLDSADIRTLFVVITLLFHCYYDVISLLLRRHSIVRYMSLSCCYYIYSFQRNCLVMHLYNSKGFYLIKSQGINYVFSR